MNKLSESDIIKKVYHQIAEIALDFDEDLFYALNKTINVAESIGAKKEVTRNDKNRVVTLTFLDQSIFKAIIDNESESILLVF